MTDAALVSRSVREFVASVASVAEPVPAGGSVAALTGAASAALLVLVCSVLARRHVPRVDGLHVQAADLQQRLLSLVDEDADAFRAFLDAKRSGGDLGPSAARTSRTPLLIGTACADVADLSRHIENAASLGLLLADVRAARHLAQAGVAAALDLAELNLGLLTAVQDQQALRDEIDALRRR